jgi:hypothetical protein
MTAISVLFCSKAIKRSAQIIRLWHGALPRLVTGAEHAALAGCAVVSCMGILKSRADFDILIRGGVTATRECPLCAKLECPLSRFDRKAARMAGILAISGAEREREFVIRQIVEGQLLQRAAAARPESGLACP